jgi:hypothetical protein
MMDFLVLTINTGWNIMEKDDSKEKKDSEEVKVEKEKTSEKEDIKKIEVERKAEQKHKFNVMIEKTKIWKMVAIVAILLLIVSIFTSGFTGGNNKGVGEDKAVAKAVEYINTNMLQDGMSAEVDSVEEKNGVYEIKILISDQEYTSYVTKDAGLLFTSGVEMDGSVEAPSAPQQQPAPEVVKSDKPEVELFIMSHCPYGTQAEKGMIPAVKALGDEIDFKLRFVYYAMHPNAGEVEEQLNQYCIREEQEDKLLDYLECFLTEGDGAGCLTAIKIDKAKLTSCVEAADTEFEITSNLEDKSLWLNGKFPKFNTDKALNEKYGIGGSPTLVINGAQANSGRDSVSYLRTICAAFNDAPEACNTELSGAQPSPGFGYETTSGSTTTAQCG